MHATETSNFLYAFGYRLTCQFLKWLGNPRLFRFERVPMKGPVLFVANHVSYIDPFVIGACVGREMYYMARQEIFVPWLMPFLRALHAVPVRRGEADLGALRKALRLLSEGNALLLFPEGTRTPDGEIHEAKSGVGFIARRSGVPVVPIYTSGLERILPRGQWRLRRAQLRLIAGEPRRYSLHEDSKAIAEDITHALRATRAELETLPPSEGRRLF